MSQPYQIEELSALVEASAKAGDEGKQHHCQHRTDCMKMIELVLDGEATPEQFEHIRKNIGKCLPCEHGFALEKSIKDALLLRLERKDVPPTLLESIRTRVAKL